MVSERLKHRIVILSSVALLVIHPEEMRVRPLWTGAEPLAHLLEQERAQVPADKERVSKTRSTTAEYYSGNAKKEGFQKQADKRSGKGGYQGRGLDERD